MQIDMKLLSEDDFKSLEDTFMRAIVRAFRVLAREGLIRRPDDAGTVQQAPSPPPPPIPINPDPVPAAAPVDVPVDVPAAAPVAVPVVDKPARQVGANTQSRTIKHKRKYRTASDVCYTVADRPQGYITTDEAVALLGGGESIKIQLGQWILDEDIPAVIVAGYKPPTKGLPGRLMVKKQAALDRNDLRKHNAASLPRFRKASSEMKAGI
jgi:hypothetical protein